VGEIAIRFNPCYRQAAGDIAQPIILGITQPGAQCCHPVGPDPLINGKVSCWRRQVRDSLGSGTVSRESIGAGLDADEDTPELSIVPNMQATRRTPLGLRAFSRIMNLNVVCATEVITYGCDGHPRCRAATNRANIAANIET